jgi:hypothetical protein
VLLNAGYSPVIAAENGSNERCGLFETESATQRDAYKIAFAEWADCSEGGYFCGNDAVIRSHKVGWTQIAVRELTSGMQLILEECHGIA